jgi:glycosyltransferase involved in cell wall biosynthesis
MNKLLVYTTQHMQTGGIESHLQEFCKNMSAVSDIEISLVVLNSAMLPETEDFYRSICKNVYLGRHGRSYKRIIWLLQTGVKLFFNRYAALYTNGQGNSAGIFAKLIKYNNWVHHHHTAGDTADQAGWSDAYIQTLKKADTVIACAKRNAGYMSAFLKRNISVVSCFSRQVNIGAHVTTPEKLQFGYFGRLIPEKGIDTICNLSQEPELNHIEFNLWGEGPSYPANYFDKFPLVNYRGAYKGLEGLTNAISELDAFLLLSTHAEGLPISLLEVMSAGVPWLATDKGGISDIACDPVSTRVIAADADYQEIKNAVLLMANDIKNGKIVRAKQIALYNKEFSATALVKQWRKLLIPVKI